MSLKKISIIIIVVAGVFGATAIAIFLQRMYRQTRQVTIEDVQKHTQQKREQVLKEDTSATSSETLALPAQDEIAVLLLGLDSRYATSSARCDAIHMFVGNIKDKTIKVISVPRGTYTPIPGNYEQNQQYFANLCGIMGQDYAIQQIEKFINQKADYVVKVDFSRSLGILRALRLPTTQSLMWVRNRHSFGIGDHQRSHNQALFMKDVALKKIGFFRSPVSLPLAKILHSYVDTNLDFDSFYTLLKYFADSDLGDHPERIELTMKPDYKTIDYHFDFNNPESMEKKFPALSFDVVTTTVTSTSDPSIVEITTSTVPYRSLASVQNELVRFLNQELALHRSLAYILSRKLWLQVEDEKIRETIHFKIIERLLQEDTDVQTKIDILTAYIQEEEALGVDEWAGRGKERMNHLLGLVPPLYVYSKTPSTSSTPK